MTIHEILIRMFNQYKQDDFINECLVIARDLQSKSYYASAAYWFYVAEKIKETKEYQSGKNGY